MTSVTDILLPVAPTARSDPAREAWAAMATLWFGDETHDRFHDACEAIDVAPPVLKALLSLERDDPKPMWALASAWRCDASWVTSVIDTLEQRGMVERRILPTDRRVKTVVLTEVGEKAREAALERLHDPPACLAALGVTEQRQLCDLLTKVVEASRPRAGHEPNPPGHA